MEKMNGLAGKIPLKEHGIEYFDYLNDYLKCSCSKFSVENYAIN